MPKTNLTQKSPARRGLSRRDFLRLAAVGLLAGCSGATAPPESPAPTDAATEKPTDPAIATSTATPRPPTPTKPPTATLVPTAEVRPLPEIITEQLARASKVVEAHHAGVWSGEELESNALRQMLDASITALTGLNDADEAWGALFDPGERVAIKVNAFRNSLIWTHVPLVMAVAERLQEIGVPPENVVIFDYYTSELTEAGFAVNPDGAGVRCLGTDRAYRPAGELAGAQFSLSQVLLDCNALINMPVMKSHMLAGFTFAMKNHYGTIRRPQSFHSRRLGTAIPELNAHPAIHDRTRLIIGDALSACLRYKSSYPYWDADMVGDALLMSFDPVAHDVVGFERYCEYLSDDGGDPAPARAMAQPWIDHAGEIALGAHRLEDIELEEIRLS